jgi:hypothetical protein
MGSQSLGRVGEGGMGRGWSTSTKLQIEGVSSVDSVCRMTIVCNNIYNNSLYFRIEERLSNISPQRNDKC